MNDKLNAEKVCISSHTIELAEHDNYIQLSTRLCYYDDKNLNNVMLPYKGCEDQALDYANSLINMPVQAYYKKINNQGDFGDHEMRVMSDGSVEWGTESIGTHISVEIREDTVTTVSGETKTLPCLFAISRIWKRNKNIIEAIKRLYESENGLNTSWEIATYGYEYKNGIKILTDYEFLGNTILGSNVIPAYSGTSKSISLSSMEQQELMIAEALSQDVLCNSLDNNNEKKEGTVMENKNTSSIEENEIQNISNEEDIDMSDVESSIEEKDKDKKNDEIIDDDKDEMDDMDDIDDDDDDEKEDGECKKKKGCATDESKKKKGCAAGECKKKKASVDAETSSITIRDLMRMLSEECCKKTDCWCSPSIIFPEEHVVWCMYDGESELDYLKFTYEVVDDKVVLSDPEQVKLSVSPIDINTTVSEYEKTIAEKDELIVKASSEITSLKAENAELSQYKDKFTQMEQEKLDAEIAEKKENLIASVVKSGMITREEIEASAEMSEYVQNLDSKSLMAIVGERLSASVGNDAKAEVETSSEKSEVHISSNLNNDDDEEIDKASIMRKFLHK